MVATLDQVFREEWGRVLATLIGFIRDFDLAEEAAQEAFAIAADRWPRDGIPSNPRAWLITTARNRATDRIRREQALAAKSGLLAAGRLVDQLGLDDFRYLHSTRAELLRRHGRFDEARDAYRRARELTDDGAERRFLERRLTELAAATPSCTQNVVHPPSTASTWPVT